MKWKVRNNVISELYFDDNNIINPWGVETSDKSSFYSQETGIGYRYEIISEESEERDRQFQTTSRLKFKTGTIQINTLDKIIDKNKLSRSAELKALTDIKLIDFVLRFRFKKKFFSTAIINDKRISFKNTNIYHQFEVNSARLEGKKYTVDLSVEAKFDRTKWKSVLYVRDSNDEWIVHARLLPINFDEYVIKLCSKWFQTRPINRYLTKLLSKDKKTIFYLTYHSEKKPYETKFSRFFNPNAFPLSKIAMNSVIYWEADLIINAN